MNAPDKFYIQPRTIDELPRQNIIYTKRLSDTSIEYLRKDALLAWAKERAESERISAGGCANMHAAGKFLAYKELFDKINSL